MSKRTTLINCFNALKFYMQDMQKFREKTEVYRENTRIS